MARTVPDTMVHRDFFVENLLLLPRPGLATLGLLDFQDAVVGPITYDLVSLLEDARRDLPAPLIDAMRARYRAASRSRRSGFRCLVGGDRRTSPCEMPGSVRAPGQARRQARLPAPYPAALAPVGPGGERIPRCTPLAHWLEREVPTPRRVVPDL